MKTLKFSSEIYWTLICFRDWPSFKDPKLRKNIAGSKNIFYSQELISISFTDFPKRTYPLSISSVSANLKTAYTSITYLWVSTLIKSKLCLKTKVFQVCILFCLFVSFCIWLMRIFPRQSRPKANPLCISLTENKF